MPPRLFTLEEANRLVGPITGLLRRAQGITAEMRSTRDQLVDLRIIWGDAILQTSCPDRAEYEGYQARFAELEAQLQAATGEITALGCELKDLDLGLVDFSAARAGEIVYLCWKRGEPRVAWWHPLRGGYAARKPLDSF